MGSIARDTWLRGNKDIDFFLKFSEDLSKEELKKLGLDVGREVAKKLNSDYLINYAEHPYVQILYLDFKIEIVPCYDLKSASDLKSAVDRTPFHNNYLMDRLNSKLISEIRIFKQFLKENSLYGAEARIEGFSGYLCELLILKYESFIGLIEDVCRWKKREGVQIEEHFPQREVLKRFYENLVVIDPVDKFRNVASALSRSNYFKFIYLAKKFNENPDISFFFKKKPKLPKRDQLRKIISLRNTLFVGIFFESKPLVEDVLYPQLKKTAKAIFRSLQKEDIQVLRYDYFSENNFNLILFELYCKDISGVKRLFGPPVSKYDHVKNFLEKYKKDNAILSGPWIAGDKIVIEIKRDTDIKNLFKNILSKDNLGAGKNIKEDIKSSKLLFNSDILDISESFNYFVYSYLNKSDN